MDGDLLAATSDPVTDNLTQVLEHLTPGALSASLKPLIFNEGQVELLVHQFQDVVEENRW